MCKHEVQIKIENGYTVTYCKKCGAILDSKATKENKKDFIEQNGYQDNGGQILHG